MGQTIKKKEMRKEIQSLLSSPNYAYEHKMIKFNSTCKGRSNAKIASEKRLQQLHISFRATNCLSLCLRWFHFFFYFSYDKSSIISFYARLLDLHSLVFIALRRHHCRRFFSLVAAAFMSTEEKEEKKMQAASQMSSMASMWFYCLLYFKS